jgi:hypothetical protein
VSTNLGKRGPSSVASEEYGYGYPSAYSGLGDSSSDGGVSDEDDRSAYGGDGDGEDDYSVGGLDIGDVDMNIPVTGFAVASSKRNADFHDLFPNVPEGDYLIEGM